MEFKKNNHKYKFWHSPIALLLIFIFLILFIYNIIGLIEKERETAQKKDLALEQLSDLRAREDLLKKDIQKFQTEEGQEEIIRDKYQVAKEGEKMVTIVDEESSSEQLPDKKENHGFWNWFRGLFVKKN